MNTSITTSEDVEVIIRAFLTSSDVMKILGCRENKAYEVIRKINKDIKKRGELAFPAGKVNKYRFSEIMGIPLEFIDKVIKSEDK